MIEKQEGHFLTRTLSADYKNQKAKFNVFHYVEEFYNCLRLKTV